MDRLIFQGLLPDWAPWDSRYADNWINSLWLSGKEYNHIPYAYSEKVDNRNRPLQMWEKRPAVRLNLPAMGGRLSSRKLFVGKHAPTFETDGNEKLSDSIKWLAKQSKLFWHGLDTAFKGQAGSVGCALKIVDDKPIYDVIEGKNCYPYYDDGNNLVEFETAWVINGYNWLALRVGETDCRGAKIVPEGQYWFIRRWNTEALATLLPIPVDDWNPETKNDPTLKKPVESLSSVHNLGFVPIVWIRNMPDGSSLDGPSSFGEALSNCVSLDYMLSQFGRGFNYMGNPQLYVKGKIITSNRNGHIFGPETMLQLPADKKNQNGDSITGAEAKLLEMSGDGMKVGLELWIERVKTWTLEQMSLSRKDVTNIKGQMSGSAIMLLDEDFYDYVEGMKVPYGDYGVLAVIQMFLRMFSKQSHAKVGKFTDDEINDIELAWPRMYEPEPAEVKMLVEGLSGAVVAGFMETEEGSEILSAAIDKQLTATEPEENDLLAKPGIPDPVVPGAAPAAKPKAKAKSQSGTKKKTAPKV